MDVDIIQILSRISQEDLDLFRPQDLAKGLGRHGAKHVADSGLEVQSNEAKLLVLLGVSSSRSTACGADLCPCSDGNFEDFAGYIGEASFLKRLTQVLARTELHTKAGYGLLSNVEELGKRGVGSQGAVIAVGASIEFLYFDPSARLHVAVACEMGCRWNEE